MKKLSIFALLFSSLLGFCQGDQTIISVTIGPGVTEQAILHLPDDYSKTTTRYPVMVFLHGNGEAVTPSAIYTSSTAGGPAYFIATGKFPASFVNPVDKQSYKFIIVSPQSSVGGISTTAAQLEYILTYLIQNYRIDTTRIYPTGISAGGEGVLEYVGKIDGNGVKVPATHKIAAFIPMSAVMNASLYPGYADTIFVDNVHIWGFGSPTDTHGANTLNMIWYLNNTIQKTAYGLTTSYTGGHCCWNQFYDPAFTQGGMNIYQWALQYSTGPATAPPVVAPPPVVVKPAVDSAGIIKAYLAAHPCPILVCPPADSAGIIKAYVAGHPCPICPVCPPPVVCPACPVIPPQRTAVKIISDLVTGISSILYSDGVTLPLPK